MNNVFLLFLIVAGVGLVFVPILIGIYVHRDAKLRNMNAVLWAFVSILVPGFLGLIIYLIIRDNYMNQRCPNCTASAVNEYSKNDSKLAWMLIIAVIISVLIFCGLLFFGTVFEDSVRTVSVSSEICPESIPELTPIGASMEEVIKTI